MDFLPRRRCRFTHSGESTEERTILIHDVSADGLVFRSPQRLHNLSDAMLEVVKHYGDLLETEVPIDIALSR